MKCKEICERIEASYPVAYACEWDNPGLLVGSDEKEVSRIYLALEDVYKRQVMSWACREWNA